MSSEDKRTANHLFNRVRVYDALIEAAEQDCDFATAEHLEREQSAIRVSLRAIIFPARD